MIKTIRVGHPELGIIIKADIALTNNDPVISNIKFGLPRKATKLEKLLLKYAEIYCYDVIRNNFHDIIVNSVEYRKMVLKHGRQSLQQVGV